MDTLPSSSSTCSTFEQADDYCMIRRASLPVISSKEESRFIQESYLSSSFWLNMKRNTTSNEWQWRDGSSLFFNKLKTGQPSNTTYRHDCAVVENGVHDHGWEKANCSACRNTICHKGKQLNTFGLT